MTVDSYPPKKNTRSFSRLPVGLAVLLAAAGIAALLSCSSQEENGFHSAWPPEIQRTWTGPEYWANRLQDWRIKDGSLECLVDDAGKPLRTVHLLTRRLEKSEGNLSMHVKTGILSASGHPREAAAGFLVGAGGNLDYRAASLIHHSLGSGAGLFAGMDGSGRLFIKDLNRDGITLTEDQNQQTWEEIDLYLSIHQEKKGFTLSFSCRQPDNGAEIKKIQVQGLDVSALTGNLALISHPGEEGETARFWFRDWEVRGSLLESHPQRLCGPILSTQHTLSDGVLNMAAQLLPLGEQDSRRVNLEIERDGKWFAAAKTELIYPGWTAEFHIQDWDDTRDTPYRVSYDLQLAEGKFLTYYRQGIIRRSPKDQDVFTVAAFTGNHNAQGGVDGGQFPWDKGLWFPHNDIIEHVREQNPDFLFFSGDQVYEGASPTAADFSSPILDYMYKWYLWCWAFRDLTRDIPAVSVPDDHDVFHGNLWGAGGRATTPGTTGAEAQDSGGYKLSPEFVNMVERTQTGSLPDPPDPSPVEQGIGVYYCAVDYGGLSFAVIEDRKFKSAPKPLLPEADVWNGWPQNEHFDPKTEADVPGAHLLGERQLNFLEDWAADWSGGTWMKALLSQTLFSTVATLPEGAKSGSIIPSLPILEAGEYAKNDHPVADMDSNGWPQTGRNRAVSILRKAFAVHISGDQHLGSTIQYGVDEWRDSGFAICVPSVANFWPRRWYPSEGGKNRAPGSPIYTGDFEDGFGNRITVFAVSNPTLTDREPVRLHQRAPGYGIIRFHKKSREIVFENWPRWASPLNDKPYPGWPVKIAQEDNYGRKAGGWLPTITVTGMENPVIQVIHQDSGSVLYTIRAKGPRFSPKVFELGMYTLGVGEPGTEKYKTIKDIQAVTNPDESEISILF